eukprot:6173534-Pleurochrysis_carterae.AAC.2
MELAIISTSKVLRATQRCFFVPQASNECAGKYVNLDRFIDRLAVQSELLAPLRLRGVIEKSLVANKQGLLELKNIAGHEPSMHARQIGNVWAHDGSNKQKRANERLEADVASLAESGFEVRVFNVDGLPVVSLPFVFEIKMLVEAGTLYVHNGL